MSIVVEGIGTGIVAVTGLAFVRDCCFGGLKALSG
jgi:hypothetical protein